MAFRWWDLNIFWSYKKNCLGWGANYFSSRVFTVHIEKNCSGLAAKLKKKFIAPEKKNSLGGIFFFHQECSHKSNLHSLKVWEWSDKNWSGQKAKTPQKHVFFQALNRIKTAKKTENLFLSKKNLLKMFFGFFCFLAASIFIRPL